MNEHTANLGIGMLPDFRALFEGTPNLYLVLDPQLTIVAVNDAYCGATMTKREQIVFRPLFEVFPDNPDDTSADGVSNLRASLMRVLRNREPDLMPVQKYDIAGPDGTFEERHWAPLNTPVFDPQGKLAWIIHRVEDVTEAVRGKTQQASLEHTIEQLKATNAALAQRNLENTRLQAQHEAAEAQLRQAQKMEAIGNLTGGLAHDFNNLLSVVIGNIDLLREELDEQPNADALAGEALEAALRGAELTKRLLAFARKQPLQPRLVDVNDLVADLSKLLKRTMGDNFSIRLRPGNGIWPVTVDPTQLENCLVNLAANARDAMPRGGELTMTTDNRYLDEDYVSLHPGLVAGDYTLLEVTDTGSGIPKEIVDKIFEPFFTTKREGSGTGLGLAMVFGFMKQSGGHINVYSEEGVGTTFRLYLPRAAGVALGRESASSSAALGGRETVLAVEDNPGLRNLVVKQLTQLGYRCLEAEDGPSAMKILEQQRVDLVFTDVIMPNGMSGYELGRAAKTRWPAIKVLLTSGFPEEKLNGNGQPPWNMRLLTKPYRKEDLARMLREVFEET
jgi:signal transduction histidine kinase/CheY-like chemotaxis protein